MMRPTGLGVVYLCVATIGSCEQGLGGSRGAGAPQRATHVIGLVLDASGNAHVEHESPGESSARLGRSELAKVQTDPSLVVESGQTPHNSSNESFLNAQGPALVRQHLAHVVTREIDTSWKLVLGLFCSALIGLVLYNALLSWDQRENDASTSPPKDINAAEGAGSEQKADGKPAGRRSFVPRAQRLSQARCGSIESEHNIYEGGSDPVAEQVLPEPAGSSHEALDDRQVYWQEKCATAERMLQEALAARPSFLDHKAKIAEAEELRGKLAAATSRIKELEQRQAEASGGDGNQALRAARAELEQLRPQAAAAAELRAELEVSRRELAEAREAQRVLELALHDSELELQGASVKQRLDAHADRRSSRASVGGSGSGPEAMINVMSTE